MQSVIEHLRSHAPANAVFYRLVGRSAGEYTLYPRDGNAFYRVGEAPRGLVPGLYQVFFFEASGRQIQTARVELSLSEAVASALGPTEGVAAPQLGLAMGSPPSRALAASPAQLSLPLSSAQSASANASATLARDQAEHRMRMERDQQQQNFIHNSVYAREAGETLMLQRMMRQEMVEMQQQALRNEQEGWDQIEKRLATLRMMREAQKEAIAELSQIPTPPTPKQDWTPLIFSAIQTVQAIGMALVDKYVAAPRSHEAPVVAVKPGPTAAKEQRGVTEPPGANDPPISSQGKGSPAGVERSALERPKGD